MDNQPEVIRQQMEETRTSLQEKLEVLEQQVLHTVKEAGQTVENVKETVEAVKDVVEESVSTAKEGVQETVATVKDTLSDTVATVKETVSDTVETVKETFNLNHQVDKHPWPMMAGAVLVGFLGGKLMQRAPATMARAVPAQEHVPTPPMPTPHARTRTNGKHHGPGRRPATFWDKMTEQYKDEIDKLKNLAVTAVGGIVRELVTEAAPPALAEGITNVVDGITTKLGGAPAQGPILNIKKHDAPRWERQAS